ncbi:MAG: alr0857 family protein [Chroococcales cyanobacterium]
MLKLTYTENNFSIEQLSQPLEAWVTTRVTLALRAGTPLTVEPTTASFLLPIDLPYLGDLEVAISQENNALIGLDLCDEDYVEVSLEGTWITSNPETEEGIFVTTMPDAVEFFLVKLWQEAKAIAVMNYQE